MRVVFAAFFSSYLVRTVYQYMDGHWDELIEEHDTRQIAQLLVSPFFDIPSIGAILFIHYKNYTLQEKNALDESQLADQGQSGEYSMVSERRSDVLEPLVMQESDKLGN